ncbi:cobalamin-binding protein [Empedobacter stercoris]|uniref:Cobalamin-binding protein n=1 Tax=Empedobacter falsenii TaxID=343874 RepID=A0ABY8VCH4_9FLAO|nr:MULTISPECIES: cobalamin-binding protein [Empedobacter]MDM1523343.1 cobalamin-binding protein [Empedobacter sp. 225-1]MDM1543242.1 cobalamin-binding protein [Empedobacter sp. 189-2]UWX67789.1 cobalamin-binding protein [Empedobacter stercoris]WIH97973.1 cobalamin-binding protein [Empedobacter falsenii]HJD87025.1 cobalamin-binding protein [Empedobacter falsenii]
MFINRYPQRIVCLTEEGTEILYTINEQHRLVGISGFTYRPPQARKEKPKVSTFLDAKFEEIIELKPDLVIGYSDLQADIAAELIRRGINVLIFNHRTVEEILNMILQFTSLIGCQDKGIKLVESYEKRIETIKKQASLLPYQPTVFFEEWDEPIISGSAWVNDLIEIAGGKLAFPELKNKALAKDRILLDKQVIERNPEIIIGSWCGKMFKPEKVEQRIGFEKIKAVQNNHLYEIKSELILQPGPAALTDGLDEIVQIINNYK